MQSGEESITHSTEKRSPGASNSDLDNPKRRKLDFGSPDGAPNSKAFRVEHYTVGWVCALYIEMAAAKCMLDDIHDNLKKSPDDSNTYILGSLHQHNVAIACLPTEGYGTNNAATVASNMYRTFPSIQTFLVVGIGGGAPGKLDIRLGDVAVGTKVIQHDLGKTIQQGQFLSTDIARQPRPTLRTAISTLRAHHESELSKVPLFLSQMRERYPAMIEYTDREHLQDVLFESAYDHPESNTKCNDCDQTRQIHRPVRSNSIPVIHYGTIASGNRVIKYGTEREQLAQNFDAICFEMEAAGLMDSLQCLVIRGICDYSDSHKGKEWQKYASATAAAYAKELLSVIPSTEPRRPLGNSLSTLEEAQDHRKRLMDSLWFDKIDARHSSIKSAYGKTCAWLLSHPDYIGWLTPSKFSDHHGLLWIHGKPGAGKSTIMKYLHARTSETQDITISFFFNARGDELEKSTQGMYRSLLFQLFEKLPELGSTGQFDPIHGINGCWKVDDLQQLFSSVVSKLGSRRIMCFVDALDECSEFQIRHMVEHFEELGYYALEAEGKLYICFSSRHYPTIFVQHGLSLTLEDQIGHGQDLEKYIRSKLRAGKGKDVESVKATLLEKAAGVFMWVVLVVNIVNQEYQTGRIFAVRKRLRETPAELSALFRDILTRDSKNLKDLLLCIQWLLYAKRPLKPEEFYYAMVAGLDPEPDNLDEWDPQQISRDDINHFVSNSSKGLAEVTKSRAGTVQFIHESVRDFLVKDGGIGDLWPELEADFHCRSHNQLRDCCYAYIKTDVLSSLDFAQLFPDEPRIATHMVATDCNSLPPANSPEAKDLRQRMQEKFPFLEYATHQALYHADVAAEKLPQDEFMKGLDLNAWIYYTNLLEKYQVRRYTPSASLPYILAENNFARLISSFLLYDSKVHIHGERYDYPLFAAMQHGHLEAARALLETKDDDHHGTSISADPRYGVNCKNSNKQVPLLWAIQKNNWEVVQLLLDKGADAHHADEHGKTPLLLAAELGFEKVVKQLLEKTIRIKSVELNSLLQMAGRLKMRAEVVQTILSNQVDNPVHIRSFGDTLLWTAEEGNKELVGLLLEKGAGVYLELRNDMGETPLVCAARKGHREVVQLLLDAGANIEVQNFRLWTPLLSAVNERHITTVQLLIHRGANIEAEDFDGWTPLMTAAQFGQTHIAQLLIDHGATTESADTEGWTMLHWAAHGGHKDVVKLLLKHDACVEPKDKYGGTPLMSAAQGGYSEIVQLLSERLRKQPYT
ncbi:hypothetical protein F5Y18DRAFT_155535 [Xylariaceae sp. FL1019]|nr:hypothetical protein F5Y18DRAFT_155535 [Xylariaceae sp. FL1019]